MEFLTDFEHFDVLYRQTKCNFTLLLSNGLNVYLTFCFTPTPAQWARMGPNEMCTLHVLLHTPG